MPADSIDETRLNLLSPRYPRRGNRGSSDLLPSDLYLLPALRPATPWESAPAGLSPTQTRRHPLPQNLNSDWCWSGHLLHRRRLHSRPIREETRPWVLAPFGASRDRHPTCVRPSSDDAVAGQSAHTALLPVVCPSRPPARHCGSPHCGGPQCPPDLLSGRCTAPPLRRWLQTTRLGSDATFRPKTASLRWGQATRTL